MIYGALVLRTTLKHVQDEDFRGENYHTHWMAFFASTPGNLLGLMHPPEGSCYHVILYFKTASWEDCLQMLSARITSYSSHPNDDYHRLTVSVVVKGAKHTDLAGEWPFELGNLRFVRYPNRP